MSSTTACASAYSSRVGPHASDRGGCGVALALGAPVFGAPVLGAPVLGAPVGSDILWPPFSLGPPEPHAANASMVTTSAATDLLTRCSVPLRASGPTSRRATGRYRLPRHRPGRGRHRRPVPGSRPRP